MAGSAPDVEAGRAFVTLYLKRTKYDQQVADLGRKNEQADRPSQVIASQTEAGASIPAEIATAAAHGAAARAGAVTLSKMVPMFREVGTAAAGTAVQVAAVGTAAAATAPAVAAAGTAATGASVGFTAMAAAAAPVLIPLAAVAAAAGAVYVTIFKWEKLPIIVRLAAMAFVPLVAVIRLAVNAFKLLKLGVQVLFLPITMAVKAVNLLVAAVTAIPRAIAAIPGLMHKTAAAAWEMGKRVGSAAKTMAVEVGKAAAATVATLAKLPGRLAGYAASAVEGVSSALRNVGTGLAKVGGVAAGLSAAIVGPMTMAAQSWAAYGDKIRDIQNQLLRFQLTAEEASIIARVSEQTGESVQKLAEQLRDGTRDFSRWKTEIQNSGMMMSGTGLSAALALSRAYYSLRESLAGLKNAIGAAIGPTLTKSTQLLTGIVQAVTKWITANKPLVAQVFKIASAVGVAATAVVTLGGAIAGAGTILTPFTAALAAIAGALAIVEVRTNAGRSLWAAYGASVQRVYGTVVQYLGQMAAFAGKVVGGVKDALMAGDMAAAVDVMWAGAKAAWFAALQEIDNLTSGTFGGILQSLMAGDWAAAGEGVMNALQQAWLAGINILAGLWDTVVDAADTAWTAIQQGFDAAVGAITSAWVGMLETLKSGMAQMLQWAISNVFRPLVSWMEEHDSLLGIDSGVGEKARAGFGKLLDAQGALERSRKTPEELAASQSQIGADTAASQAQREEQSEARRAARQAASDAARLAREQEITALRQRQAELAGQAGSKAAAERTANQTALDAAIAAAKAARDAADAGRLTDKDFAVSTKTQSIVRFSGEALGMSVGRNDPAKETAKLSREQLKELRTIANALGTTLKEVLRLQQMGGFA